MTCLFCDIAAGKISTNLVYQDELIVAFNDIKPQAAQHILIIPRKHIATLNELQPEDNQVAGLLLQTASSLAKKLHFAESGYRIVMNCNKEGGQEIYHIHLHLLGGRQMQWPPG